jgi:hypothetical protein
MRLAEHCPIPFVESQRICYRLLTWPTISLRKLTFVRETGELEWSHGDRPDSVRPGLAGRDIGLQEYEPARDFRLSGLVEYLLLLRNMLVLERHPSLEIHVQCILAYKLAGLLSMANVHLQAMYNYLGREEYYDRTSLREQVQQGPVSVRLMVVMFPPGEEYIWAP